MNYLIAGVVIILYVMMAILTGCILEVKEEDDSWFICVIWPLVLVVGLFCLWYKKANKIAKKIRRKFDL